MVQHTAAYSVYVFKKKEKKKKHYFNLKGET